LGLVVGAGADGGGFFGGQVEDLPDAVGDVRGGAGVGVGEVVPGSVELALAGAELGGDLGERTQCFLLPGMQGGAFGVDPGEVVVDLRRVVAAPGDAEVWLADTSGSSGPSRRGMATVGAVGVCVLSLVVITTPSRYPA
jgi:hypothetical protein